MRERHKNIFYNLVRNETSLTEIFCNLMVYKSFRNSFLEFVREKSNNLFDVSNDKVEFKNFETEKDFGNEFNENTNEEDKKVGRGDLILDLYDREYIFELKIETYTSTTKNQPYGYFRYLEEIKKQSRNDLYFILPKNYKYMEKLCDVNSSNIFYWEDFISLLKIKGLDDVTYISDFIDILNNRWFYSEEFEFTEYEKNVISNKRKVKMNDKTIPHIMMDLTHKVDLITEKVVKNKNYYSNYKDESGYGIFIKNENKEDTLWFGIDYKFWKENEIPLTIGVYGDNDEYVNLLQNKYGDEIKEIEFEKDDFFYYLPLPLEIYKTTEKIENKIKEVKLLLGIE